MTHVVTENCINCKHSDCVEVCPVVCFHEGPNFIVIDEKECIDCTICVDACPVGAIYAEEDLPEKYQNYTEINKKYSKEWPLITSKIDPMEDAEVWDGVEGKLELLQEVS